MRVFKFILDCQDDFPMLTMSAGHTADVRRIEPQLFANASEEAFLG
jgi:hypothetical protein